MRRSSPKTTVLVTEQSGETAGSNYRKWPPLIIENRCLKNKSLNFPAAGCDSKMQTAMHHAFLSHMEVFSFCFISIAIGAWPTLKEKNIGSKDFNEHMAPPKSFTFTSQASQLPRRMGLAEIVLICRVTHPSLFPHCNHSQLPPISKS